MNIQLLANVNTHKERFDKEHFTGTDDILILMKSGSFITYFDGKEVTVSANEGFIFKRATKYYRILLEPATMYLFRYKSDYAVTEKDKLIFHDLSRLNSTMSLLDKLDKTISKDDWTFRESLFSDIVTQYCLENNDCFGQDQYQDEIVQETIIWLKTRIKKKIDLSKLSKKYGISQAHFIRRFKAATSMTPTEYISFLRLQKAKQLLVDTDLLIKEISIECGFSNEYYFSNFFKKHTSLSPQSFRKEML